MGPWYKSSKSLYKFVTMNKAHRCEHCWLGIFQVYFWRMLELQCLNCSTKGTLLSPAVHEMLLTVKPSIGWARMYPRIFQGRGGGDPNFDGKSKEFFYNFYMTSNRHSCFLQEFWCEMSDKLSHRFETKGVHFLEPPSGSTTVEYPTGTLWQTWNVLCWLWQVFNCFAERQMN